MGKIGIEHLVAKGCQKVTVANRNKNKVAAICEELKGAEIIFKPFDHLLACAVELDIIFPCTASDTPLFLEQVGGFPRATHVVDGMRLFVDISLPRNVYPSVGDFEGAKVYHVDDLKEVVDANKEDRHCKAMESQAIMADKSQRIEEWRDSLETVPTIKKLLAYAERITLAELEKCLSKLGYNVPKKTNRAVDDLSRGIVNRLLHVDVPQRKRKDAE